MTATATFPNTNYDTEAFAITDTNEATVWTAPGGFSGGFNVVELWIADVDGTANTVTIKATIDGTARILGKNVVIDANTPKQFNFTGLVMNEDDTIKLTIGSASCDGYVTFIKNGRAA